MREVADMPLGKRLLFRLLEFYGTRVHHRGKWWVHTRLRRLMDFEASGEFLVERLGLKWVLDPCDYVQRDVFWFGEKDRWDAYHLLRMARPGAVFMDVGANFGYYSVVLAHRLKGDCAVYSFEPCSSTFERLQRHVRMNGLTDCVHPRNQAMGDRRGRVRLVGDGVNSGENYVEPTDRGDVEMTTLDLFCEAEQLGRLDLVKMDVEGFESRVIAGGGGVLERYAPVLMIEVNPPLLRRADSSPSALLAALRDLGYELCVTRRRKLMPLVGDVVGDERINVFCLPVRD